MEENLDKLLPILIKSLENYNTTVEYLRTMINRLSKRVEDLDWRVVELENNNLPVGPNDIERLN